MTPRPLRATESVPAARPGAAVDLVSTAEPSLSGRLELEGGVQVPVSVTCASRISLFVSFGALPPPEHHTPFRRLLLDVRGREVALSACRFHAERPYAPFAGRLIFTEDIYDCRALLCEGTLVNLKNYFHHLPLVRSQQEQVRPEFKEMVGRALYELSVHRRFFDEQDQILAGEGPEAALAAREVVRQSAGRPFFEWLDSHLRELEAQVQGFSKEEQGRHGFYLRRQVWPYILCSEFIKRTNLKPRGYAGDAEMMEMLYANTFVGAGLFEQLMHKHPLETSAAQAVRNRRLLVPRLLRRTQARFPSLPAHGFRFLSVASGPAREIEDLYVSAEDFASLRCTLLDQDSHALDMARAGVARVEAERGIRIEVECINESVRTMLRLRDLPGRFGRFHFIYSMGLFDYLTPPVARAVLARMYELLLPGGTLVVGNYHVRNPTRVYMDYWMDWPLYYRTEESFLDMAAGLEADASITFDDTGSQMFLQLEKP